MKLTVGNLNNFWFTDKKTATEGDRKISLTLYIIHHIILIGLAELLFWYVAIKFAEMAPKDVIDLYSELNAFLLWGFGAALTIYSGANVAGTFSKGGKPPLPAPPQNDPNDLKG